MIVKMSPLHRSNMDSTPFTERKYNASVETPKENQIGIQDTCLVDYPPLSDGVTGHATRGCMTMPD